MMVRLYCGHGGLRYSRIYHERAYGKALPREMVGLLQQKIQHSGAHLPRAHVLLGHSLAALPLSRAPDSCILFLTTARFGRDSYLRLRACGVSC